MAKPQTRGDIRKHLRKLFGFAHDRGGLMQRKNDDGDYGVSRHRNGSRVQASPSQFDDLAEADAVLAATTEALGANHWAQQLQAKLDEARQHAQELEGSRRCSDHTRHPIPGGQSKLQFSRAVVTRSSARLDVFPTNSVQPSALSSLTKPSPLPWFVRYGRQEAARARAEKELAQLRDSEREHAIEAGQSPLNSRLCHLSILLPVFRSPARDSSHPSFPSPPYTQYSLIHWPPACIALSCVRPRPLLRSSLPMCPPRLLQGQSPIWMRNSRACAASLPRLEWSAGRRGGRGTGEGK